MPRRRGFQIWKAHDGIRTRDLFLTKEVLYRLSYMGIFHLTCIFPADVHLSGNSSVKLWSGKRDSNPRPRAWKARALPTELFPLSRSDPASSRSKPSFRYRIPRPAQPDIWWRGEDSNLRRHSPSDLQSDPFGHSGTSPRMLLEA